MAAKEAAGESEHLSETGDNLPRVAQFLYEQHRPVFEKILSDDGASRPGRQEDRAATDGRRLPDATVPGRVVQDTLFLDRYVSDGTIKMFAYLVLLHDPKPHPLLCVEEPENQLVSETYG